MPQAILDVKLHELDDQLQQVHERIQKSGFADQERLQTEITQLSRECSDTSRMLCDRMSSSRAGLVTELAGVYKKVEQIILEFRGKSENMAERQSEAEAEEKTLLAEYALDFAMQAANQALLLSLEAMEAQFAQRKKEKKE